MDNPLACASVERARAHNIMLCTPTDDILLREISTHSDGEDGLMTLLDEAGTLKTSSALFSITSVLLGAGLSVPYGFWQTGPIIGLLGITFVAVVVSICVWLVAASLSSTTCLDIAMAEGVTPQNRELGFLAYCAFGRTGQVIASIILSLELWFALLVAFVAIGVNGSLLVNHSLSQSSIIVLSGVALFPLLDAPVWLLGGAGIASLVGDILCTLAFADASVEAALASQPQASSSTVSSDPGGFLTTVSALGIFFYSYGNAACLPPIRNEMQHVKHFSAVTVAAFAVSVVFYNLLGFMGTMFGDNIGQSYQQNITQILPLRIACAAVIISQLMVMPLLTNTIFRAMLPLVRLYKKMHIVMCKLVFTAISVVVSMFLQDELAATSSLTGNSLTMCTCVVMPAILYWRLAPQVSLMERAFLIALVICALAFAVVGTYATIQEVAT